MMRQMTLPIQKNQIYRLKKQKQPDHLIKLISKNKAENECLSRQNITDQMKKIIKQKIFQKRIDNILKTGSSQVKTSQPQPYLKKKWISPLDHLKQIQNFDPLKEKAAYKVGTKKQQKEQVKNVVKILDINKRLKYFGQFLQVDIKEIKDQARVQVAHLTEKQTKTSYLTKKFYALEKQIKPKLFIMSAENQKQKLGPINYLQKDQFYQNIMRVKDNELMQILIKSLQSNGKFTLTSYITFYDIFVWQSSDKIEQIEFVANILMGLSSEKSIVQISKIIDLICRKIHIENFNKSLQNFNETMKKLIFGDDYEYADQKEYFLTRKALIESLERNEECISIFINIFYSG